VAFERVTRELWVEEPAVRYRMPDAVRTAAVRAVIITAVTLIEAMVALLATLADSWLAFPMVISSIASTVLATWAVLDVWVTRQVWNQRNGVVSVPSSTARQLRRERRRARRAVRAARGEEARIGRRGGLAGRHGAGGYGRTTGREGSRNGGEGATDRREPAARGGRRHHSVTGSAAMR
jgi:hypothetical protein